jgi:hypothetical protein
MAHDVFISYAKADREVADRICAALEGDGIKCWIAPRDVRPGQDYQVQIVRAIQACKLLVLIYSSEIETSPFVPRELERAVAKNIPILPFKITEELPSEKIELFLAMSQWLDATKGSLTEHIRRLVRIVAELLQKPLSEKPIQHIRKRPRLFSRKVLLLAGAFMLVLIGFLGVKNSNLRSSMTSLLQYVNLNFGKRATAMITVRSSPEAANLVLNGTLRGPTPVSDLAVGEGKHRIQLSKQDYIPLDTILVVSENGPFTFTYALQKSSHTGTPINASKTVGSLSVISNPKAAKVWIDGHQTGITPLTADKIAAGNHQVEIALEGYTHFVQDVTVYTDSLTAVNAALVRLKGSLRVTSTPAGATVLLDGQRKGITPCTIERLPSRGYRMELQKEGYSSFIGSAAVAPNKLNYAYGELEITTGTLAVRVIPSGIIYIDRDRKTEDSNAPYSIELVPGKYEVTAVSLTWGRWTKSVELNSSEDVNIAFDFSHEFRVTVTSDPVNAKIYINDIFTGKYTPSLLSLRPGQRKIEVRKKGYELRGQPAELTLEDSIKEPIHFVLGRTPDQ